jgi:bacterial/archaeal transporter family protein
MFDDRGSAGHSSGGFVPLLPKWLIYSLLSLLSWGIFGFLGKVGSDRISAAQMQIFFTIGVVPLAVVCIYRLRFKIATSKRGVSYSVMMGIFAALGCLVFFGAMKTGKASIVAPVTSLYPALTVLLALIVLKEKLNKVQILGLILAMASIVILLL